MRQSSARVGVAVAVVSAALAVVPVLDSQIGRFNPRPTVSLALSLFLGALAALGARYRALNRQSEAAEDRERLLSQSLAVWPPRALGEVDPELLGVFPPRATGSEPLPIYVPRDVDPQVADAIRRFGFVLVFGPPKSGKTRTALEAACRVVADRPVAIPKGKDQLVAALSVDPPLEFGDKPGVLWLDDLDRYLDVIDLDELQRFGGAAGVTVVATLRIDQYESPRAWDV